MREKKRLEDIIREDILAEAERIDEEVVAANLPPMPEEVKERIKQNIYKQVKEREAHSK